ncbi:rhomboid-like protein 20 isoform X2 [Prosopis cineraria]|uniref:rhomboid-like protein 20 isoform X2 n=1 Tax=Prosopis cineraria TaxID=364024 RepID=UPI00240EC426|nr:rhomboid-like protein 20 isoform X2 [Prosopis cineraria]
MNAGPSGFTNAPVTRTFIIASALFTIFFGIQGRYNRLGLSYQDIFGKLRLWKLIMSIFAFSSTPESMFGLFLLYYFRVFERQIGSNKYSVFITFSMLISLLFEVLSVAILKVSTRFHVAGFHFSDKSFIYLAGLQLLLSSWKRSLLPGMCGILAGSLYRLNVFYIRRAKFPAFIASFFSRTSLPSMGSPRSASTRNVVGNMPSYPARQMERNYPAPAQSVPEPSEDSISTLTSMGFDRDSARQALVQARNDVNVATNILLEAQSHQ